MTRRQAAAAVLAASAALAVNAGALRSGLRGPGPPDDGRGERTDRALAALAAHLPPEVRVVGWRAGPDAVPFQLAQYALVPRVLALTGRTDFVLVDAPDGFAGELARAEGLVEVARADGFHLLRRRGR